MSQTASAECFELGQFIPLHYHHVMLVDPARTGAFREAIQRLVQPDSKVVELGGGTGILSFLAAQRAKKVWYVEQNPELFQFAGRVIPKNPGSERIELVLADAAQFLPPEPVDTVICEMLHVGMLREKQLQVIDSFKKNYLAKFGAPLPRFIPEAAILAVQPVEQNFIFSGYHCPIPTLQDPLFSQPRTHELGAPANYATVEYLKAFPMAFAWDGFVTLDRPGMLNALRFITKNIIAIIASENRSVDWHSSYVVVPLVKPLELPAKAKVRVRFSYAAGAPIQALADSLTAEAVG